jgi:hypothetical protein
MEGKREAFKKILTKKTQNRIRHKALKKKKKIFFSSFFFFFFITSNNGKKRTSR